MKTRLKDYAEQKGIHYLTAWRYLKKGYLKGKKLKNGSILLVKQNREPAPRGHPAYWTREKVVAEVHRLCKDRYVQASHFPPFLYKLSVKFCGSVRAAKWEARVIHDRRWTYEKFIRCVSEFCLRRYRDEKKWPIRLRELAKHYCGSARKAKWEAGVIRDRRRRMRRRYQTLEGLWTRDKFMHWVSDYCRTGYRKPGQWPGYMRELAVRYFGSVRHAKWQAKILKDQRKNKRKAFRG